MNLLSLQNSYSNSAKYFFFGISLFEKTDLTDNCRKHRAIDFFCSSICLILQWKECIIIFTEDKAIFDSFPQVFGYLKRPYLITSNSLSKYYKSFFYFISPFGMLELIKKIKINTNSYLRQEMP